MKRLLVIAMIALSLCGVAFGFQYAGSPWEARREQTDKQRFEDLAELVGKLVCNGGTAPETLPEAGDLYCGRPFPADLNLTDPETGKPYTYVRLNDDAFKLCAAFHNAVRLYGAHHHAGGNLLTDRDLNRYSGCLTGRIRT